MCSYVDGFTSRLRSLTKYACVPAVNLGTLVRAYMVFMERHPEFAEKGKNLGLFASVV